VATRDGLGKSTWAFSRFSKSCDCISAVIGGGGGDLSGGADREGPESPFRSSTCH
jgi:hypothetical protein